MIDGGVVALTITMAGAAALLYKAWRDASKPVTTWQSREAPDLVASDTGLDVFLRELNEQAAPLSVRVAHRKDASGIETTEAVVSHIEADIKLRASSRLDAFMGEDVRTGHAPFDETFHVQGSEARVRALLSEDVRSGLLAIVNQAPRAIEVSLHGKELRVVLPAPPLLPLNDPVEKMAQRMVAVARRLDGADLPARLAENARDRVPEVRLNSLRSLLREYPDHHAAEAVVREAIHDSDPHVRVTAAVALGADGHDTLLELAASPEVEADVAARAVTALGQEPPAGVEPILLAALTREAAEVRLAAAQALATAGTSAAVLPLQEAAHRHGGALKAAARQAIDAIQSRLRGATPGQVTLSAEEAAGHVSLAEGAAGQVSLPGLAAPRADTKE
jgi:hypothetical protein